MEDEIIKIMSTQSNTILDTLDCYEPGKEQFEHLKNHDFGQGPQINVFQEAFMPETQIHLDKYDLITMFHVHYYWTSPKLRRSIMKKVFNHLNPGGIVFILMLEQGENHQVELRKATKKHISFKTDRDYQSVTLHGKKVATEEINSVAHECNVQVDEAQTYNITIDIDLSDLSKGSKSTDTLSYIISVDFDTFPDHLKEFVVNWIKEHGYNSKNSQIYQLSQSVTSLLYSKDLE